MIILPILAYLLSLLAFASNIFIYPGFITARLGLDPWLFVVLFALLAFFYPKPKYPRLFLQLNKFVVLPLSILASAFFTFAEVSHYQNYVLAAFKIHFLDFIFIVGLAGLTLVLTQTKSVIASQYQKIIFWLSVYLFCLFVVLSTGSRVGLVALAREDGLFENTQFILFAAAGIVASIHSFFLRRAPTKIRLLYLLFGLGLMFIAMEEISWGQRYFGIATPPILEHANVQDEINLHNLPAFHSHRDLAYAVVGLYGGFAWALNKLFFKKWFGKYLYLITPPKFLSLWFLSVFLYYGVHVSLFGTYNAFSEFSETMLAIGFALFVLVNCRSTEPSQA